MSLPEKSIEFYKSLMSRLIKTSDSLRFDTLYSFSEESKLDYETIKRKAKALAYAAYGESLAKVPRSMRNDVRNIHEAIKKGELSRETAMQASKIFISRTPAEDVELFNRFYKNTDPEVKRMQRNMAGVMQESIKEMIKFGVHPVRAYSLAWAAAGKKLHHEIPKVLRQVPKGELPRVMKDLWEENYYETQATRYYTRAGLKTSYMLEGFKRGETVRGEKRGPYLPLDTIPFMRERGIKIDAHLNKDNLDKYGIIKQEKDQIARRHSSDYKATKRFPGFGSLRPYPRDIKRVAKDRYNAEDLRLGKLGIRPEPKIRFEDMESKERLVDIGADLKAADELWTRAQRVKEERISPFVQLSKVRKRRFRA